MQPDVLERFVDDIESASGSEATRRTLDASGGGLRDAGDAFAALRARIAEDGPAFQVWEPAYKYLRAHPAELARAVERILATRAAEPRRGLRYRAARDARLREWALDQLDLDTRALLGWCAESHAELRRAARARVEPYLRAEAELRFRALAALAAVSASIDDADPGLTTPERDDRLAWPELSPHAAVVRLAWRAATVAVVAASFAGALLAKLLGSTPAQGVALAAAAGSTPILLLPRWVERAWRDLHGAAEAAASRGDPAPSLPPAVPARLGSKRIRAVRAALDRTVIAPTAAHVDELLDALGLDREETLERAASPLGEADPALPFGASQPSLHDAASALATACAAARVARLVPELPAATPFVRGFVESTRQLHALCADDAEAPSALAASSLEPRDDAPPRDALDDDALDALVAVLDELGYGARDELDARRVGAIRVSLERLPTETVTQVESAIYARVDGLCRRFTSRVRVWCERMAERSQLTVVEASDDQGVRHEERRVADLDELAYRVRLTEIRSDEVRRELAEVARACANGGSRIPAAVGLAAP